MTGFEIAVTAIGSVITAALATIGLQKWACSKNTQDETSSDSLNFNVNELTVTDGNKAVTIKNLTFTINESDKSNLNRSRTDGQIGDKDVSIAALSGKHSITTQDLTKTENLTTSTNNAAHNLESNLPSSGPSNTHEVQNTGQILKNFANAILEFSTNYTKAQIHDATTDPTSQNNQITTPLLAEQPSNGYHNATDGNDAV